MKVVHKFRQIQKMVIKREIRFSFTSHYTVCQRTTCTGPQDKILTNGKVKRTKVGKRFRKRTYIDEVSKQFV